MVTSRNDVVIESNLLNSKKSKDFKNLQNLDSKHLHKIQNLR
ncbi:hypothetical protein [Helicobacter saguini]|nr:hypothetical protein [Helicobacter saguini]